MSLLEAIRTRLRLLSARGTVESRAEEEIRLHLDMEADRLVREEGLDAREARRRALVAFGGVDKTKEELREGRGLAWLSGLQLDIKLGGRMLIKYPVLTFASVVALAVAVALAASWFEFMSNMAAPRIPLADADRIVRVRNLDLATGESEPRSLHDFETWRDELGTIRELSAASNLQSNLTTDDGGFAAVTGARVTPGLLPLARVQPVVGRSLTNADYDADAVLVIVIGHAVSQRLFGSDGSAIGRTVRVGPEYATVVGVMPPGFAFPVNHEFWVPMRESALNYARREGPRLIMAGRLAPGASLDEARAELTVIGQRSTAESPATHAQLRAEVRRFGTGNDMAGVSVALNVPFLLFLAVVSANVATLLFARTATRESEIAMRSALGASRARIIVQLVAESLVLTTIAAALGLTAAHWGLGWGMELFWEVQQMKPPFWFTSGVSARSITYGAVLAVFSAVIIGGIPGLRATRRQLRQSLPQPGGGGMRFGALATGVIVVQVAISVAFIPVAIMNGQDVLPEQRGSSFPAEAYLSGRLTRQLDAPGQAAQQGDETRTALLFDEVQRRLAAEPGVLAATRASLLPGFNHPMDGVEIEGDSARIVDARQVAVDPNFFDVMDARIISGRSFRETDVTGDVGVAILEETWAREAFGGRSVIGQRIRYPSREGEAGRRWYEIVGVVAGVDRAIGPGNAVAVFHPLLPGERSSVQIYLRAENLPSALVPQVQTVITSVDPTLATTDLMPLAEHWRPVQRSNVFFAAALSVVAVIIVLFALIGIYALMSFTVAQRAREIGIRAALGADPRRILASIFSRAMIQMGVGVIAGGALVSLTVARSPDGFLLVSGVAGAMVVVGLLACVMPAIRALRIQPIEALRSD